MKVKKYTAESVTEAMKFVREELGTDAVILSSKPIYIGGFLGLFKKRRIEVVAAIDSTAESNQMVVKQKPKKVKPSSVLEQLPKPVSSEPIKKDLETPTSDLLKEIADLKGMIEGLRSTGMADTHYPELLESAHAVLVKQEIAASIRTQVMDVLVAKWRAVKHEVTQEEVRDWLKSALAEQIEWISKEELAFQKKYINVVGPTGVGKTTTLAKVAAQTVLKERKKVAFITTDTYRIAAIDQLKTYAKILNVPIEVAYNLDDFKRAAERFAHYDLVFIDTAGRNFRNAQYVKDLGDIIDFTEEMETYLVLSLTSKQRDMEDIYRQFSTIPLKHIIFTKADETATYGAMINMMQQCQLAPAYITNGQNVPDDLMKATPVNILNLLFGVKDDERSS
ncbi:flagellar biosynthesis protein FlhF [Peribacillus asahii]|uniref:Flagellar biosynthesis protein FlhF n=1 Tax=Peribacillus asahii TaxID=228899 RepID=A0A3T0KPX2_9BACI|nr:flagellar biosynthesis protein FlhF [Peribacillus asahii]AZV42291.1 flagellar biosynthesis regulator FlhF [Peribacillus asahii]USK86598.1 flagellar biosynthesis protein FlhF [Peribacillus asahii]